MTVESEMAQQAAVELKAARERRILADRRWGDAILTHQLCFVGTPVDDQKLNGLSAEQHRAVIECYEAWQRKEYLVRDRQHPD
jgi:hypothetical protein